MSRITLETDLLRNSASIRSASMSARSKLIVSPNGSATSRGRPAPGRLPPHDRFLAIAFDPTPCDMI
jgi:hypothetical protein